MIPAANPTSAGATARNGSGPVAPPVLASSPQQHRADPGQAHDQRLGHEPA